MEAGAMRAAQKQLGQAGSKALLFLAFAALGSTSATASFEGPLTYQYRTCSRVIDLLYDFSGNRDVDRRELTAGLPGDQRFRNYIYDQRISHLTLWAPQQAAMRAGTIDKILKVYLATDKSRKECAAAGCTASLYYNDGSKLTGIEKVEIDRDSIIYAHIHSFGADPAFSTGLGLQLSGFSPQVVVQGTTDMFRIFQSGMFAPCPPQRAGMPKCDSYLGNIQKGKLRHEAFQTVMSERSKRRDPGKPTTCPDIYDAFPLDISFDGGPGSDTYRFARGDGLMRINDRGSPAGKDELIFAPDIKAHDLWFAERNGNVDISVIGTNNGVTIAGWFDQDDRTIETIRSGDGKVLDQTDVRLLIDAMKSFRPADSYDPGIRPGDKLPAEVEDAMTKAWKTEQ